MQHGRRLGANKKWHKNSSIESNRKKDNISYGLMKPWRKKKSTPRWTERLWEAVKNKMKKFRKWMKTRHHIDRVAYIEARRETEKIKISDNSKAWKKIGDELNRDLQGTRKLLYNLARKYQ